ncbi:MAG: type II toxin-antitoxin system HicB family antitoxin [Chloracidobacterium sp.]|nr:type II toxin-antitoxin system HicB family antitoxin [Chloracidobacterium sp.]
MKNRYLVVIEKGARNYSAFSPDVPGCIATGRTIEETIDSMRDALEFHIEGMIENGETVPAPKPLQYVLHDTNDVTGEDIIAHVIVQTPELALA